MIKHVRKLIWVAALIGFDVLLLLIAGRQMDTLARSVYGTRITGQTAWFDDEFDGNELELSRWDVFTGTPTVEGGRSCKK